MPLVARGCVNGWQPVADEADAVVVTAAGLCTPLAPSSQGSWQALRSGLSAVTSVTHLKAPARGCQTVAQVRAAGGPLTTRVAKRAKFANRSAGCALHALVDALEGIPLLDRVQCDGERVAIYAASGQTGLDVEEFFPALSAAWDGTAADYAALGGRASRLVDPYFSLRTLSNGALALLSAETGARGPSCNYVQGEMAACLALRAAMHDLREGRADAALVFACDSLPHPMTWLAYEREGLLSRRPPHHTPAPFDVNRDGLVLGEGAGLIVMELADRATARGAPALAQLVDVVVAQPPQGDDESQGVQTIQDVLLRACDRVAPQRPSDWGRALVIARGLGTVHHDAVEAAALNAGAGRFLVATAFKGATGYLGAASGLVEMILAMHCLHDRVVPKTTHLGQPDPLVEFPLARASFRLPPGADSAITLVGDWLGECAAIVLRVE